MRISSERLLASKVGSTCESAVAMALRSASAERWRWSSRGCSALTTSGSICGGSLPLRLDGGITEVCIALARALLTSAAGVRIGSPTSISQSIMPMA